MISEIKFDYKKIDDKKLHFDVSANNEVFSSFFESDQNIIIEFIKWLEMLLNVNKEKCFSYKQADDEIEINVDRRNYFYIKKDSKIVLNVEKIDRAKLIAELYIKTIDFFHSDYYFKNKNNWDELDNLEEISPKLELFIAYNFS